MPVTVESVSLIAPHNLVVHKAVVFADTGPALPWDTGWSQEGSGNLAAAWARRQPVPGGVIPPGSQQKGSAHNHGHVMYQIAEAAECPASVGGDLRWLRSGSD